MQVAALDPVLEEANPSLSLLIMSAQREEKELLRWLFSVTSALQPTPTLAPLGIVAPALLHRL